MSNPYYNAQPRATSIGYGAGYNPYALAYYPGSAGSSIVGVEPAAGTEKGFFDKTKEFLNDDKPLGVKNGYVLAGAAAVGLLWYGMSEGWFR